VVEAMAAHPFNLKYITWLDVGCMSAWDLFLVGVTPAGNLLGLRTKANTY
jgi:hypothetical protein